MGKGIVYGWAFVLACALAALGLVLIPEGRLREAWLVVLALVATWRLTMDLRGRRTQQ